MSTLTKLFKYVVGLSLITILASCINQGNGTDPVPLSIVISAEPETVEAGGEVNLAAAIVGEGATGGNVVWTAANDAGSFSDATGENVTWTAPATAGTYTLTATLTVGEASESADIDIEVTVSTVDPGPLSVSITAEPTTVAGGDDVNLAAAIAGEGAAIATVTWSVEDDAGSLSAAEGQNVSWTAPGIADTYTITATAATGGDSAQDSISIIVTEPEPLSITLSGTADSGVFGDTIQLTAEVTGYGADDVQVGWFSIGHSLNVVSDREAVFTAPAIEGTHRVAVEIVDHYEITDNFSMEIVLCNDGDRTDSADPCLIKNAVQLQAISDHHDGHFALSQDIDAGATAEWNDGAGFNPIAGLTEIGDQIDFTGSLDGRGHAITDLYINLPDTDNVGLFRSIGSGGVIRNLALVDADITGNAVVGGLTANNSGTITNSSTSGAVHSNGLRIGGLAGSNRHEVEDSYSTAAVSSDGAYVGGLVGENSGTISNSHSQDQQVSTTGDNSGTAHSVGGLLGINFATVTDSSSRNTAVESAVSNAGGLVGNNQSAGRIERSYVDEDTTVAGTFNIGGLVGMNFGTIQQSYSAAAEAGGSGSTNGTYVGGLVGTQRNIGMIEETFSKTRVTGVTNVGGFIGRDESDEPDTQVLRSYWEWNTADVDNSAGGTGVTRVDGVSLMYEEATYENWDFTDIWSIEAGDDIPDLRSNRRPDSD